MPLRVLGGIKYVWTEQNAGKFIEYLEHGKHFT